MDGRSRLGTQHHLQEEEEGVGYLKSYQAAPQSHLEASEMTSLMLKILESY